LPARERDVLAELDGIARYLRGLIGDDPQPGQDANITRLEGEMAALHDVARNILELHADYSAGKTHEQRVAASMGTEPDQAGRIAELERQLAEARSAAGG
jgi:hypothetical protein